MRMWPARTMFEGAIKNMRNGRSAVVAARTRGTNEHCAEPEKAGYERSTEKQAVLARRE